MASDEVLVALINESLNAEPRARRIAALVLIEVLRNGRDLGAPNGSGRQIIPPKDAALVADEIHALITKYRLGGDDAPLGSVRPPSSAGVRDAGA
jgi:hypothetical protein